MGCTSASRRGGPAWGSGGVTTLTVRAFGIGSDCRFHRVYVADFTTFWIASPFCAERRAPVQAAFIGRQLLFTASDWVHPHSNRGTTEGASPNSPPPRAGSRRPHPSCWRSRQDLNTDLSGLAELKNDCSSHARENPGAALGWSCGSEAISRRCLSMESIKKVRPGKVCILVRAGV